MKFAPMTCPRCGASATPGRRPQRCAGCGKLFALYAGPAGDPSVVPPPPNPRAATVSVDATRSYVPGGAVEAFGVREDVPDPIWGRMRFDASRVAFPDIVSIAVWREPDWRELFLVFLLPLPFFACFAFLTLLALEKSHITAILIFAVLALLSGLVVLFMVRRAVVTQQNFVRVFGRWRCVTVRFDRPGRRRVRLHNELLLRTGLPLAPIP